MRVIISIISALVATTLATPIAEPNPLADINRRDLASTILSDIESVASCTGGEVCVSSYV